MHVNRRTFVPMALCGCLALGLEWLRLQSQSIPPDELRIIVAVLRAQCETDTKRPVLIASERFNTGRMTILTKMPTPLERAMHTTELPYLAPPAEHVTEAEELASAYNLSLERAAPPILESAALNFPHRLLDDQVVTQFEALYPGGNVSSAELEKKRRAVSSRYRLFFDGATTLWKVSRVALARGGTLAVVGLRSSGGSCWSERWEVLERSQDSRWHSVPWGGAGGVTCA